MKDELRIAGGGLAYPKAWVTSRSDLLRAGLRTLAQGTLMKIYFNSIVLGIILLTELVIGWCAGWIMGTNRRKSE